MELKELQQHIRTLARLEATEAPFISAYVHPGDGKDAEERFLDRRMQFVGSSLPSHAVHDFKDAMQRVKSFLEQGVDEASKGAAVFCRAGKDPFFLALQFQVPVENVIAVGTVPNIYHLVELKDMYHRYVVVVLSERGMRILEVHLGAVIKELWTERPALRANVGPMLSRHQYFHHGPHSTDEFIKEGIEVLDGIVSTGGYSHLLLAGDQHLAWRFRYALPFHLSEKFVDIVGAAESSESSDVATEAITAFVAREAEESLETVDTLLQELRMDGLAAVGVDATLQALRDGIVDVLAIARTFDPHFTVKDEIARLAELNGCTVEVVSGSKPLENLGGVGCLLRHRVWPETKPPKRTPVSPSGQSVHTMRHLS
jgi:ribosomal protein L30E